MSTHRMSMLPNPCMALLFLTTVCFFSIAAPPLARHALMTIGSISGVRPTATDSANRNAASQSPCVRPQATKTTGTSTAINRISTHAMDPAP